MKKLKQGLIIGVMALTLTGCSSIQINEEKESPYNGFEYVKEGQRISELRNTETGVHYYVLNSGNRGGLTPVIESDGSIRVTN